MSRKILVVDNHPLIIKFMTKLLENAGFTVRTAEDGLAALHTLESFTPDTVIVDLVMPNISGDKLCRIIRTLPSVKDIPLVVLSAIAAEQEVNVVEFGATTCIAKGPLDAMGQHVLAVLDAIEQGDSDRFRGKTLGLDGIYVRKISEELLSSKRHAEAVLKNLTEGILELTTTGHIIFANQAAVDLLELPEEKLLASDFVDLFDKDYRERVRSLLEAAVSAPVVVSEDDPVERYGSFLTLHLHAVEDRGRTTIIVIISDITDQRRMQAQLRRAREMEAIFAGAVAHDLNNILGGLVGYPELLLHKLPNDSPLRSTILKIQDGGKRAAAIVQDLLVLASRGHSSLEVLNLNDVISDYLDSPEHESLTQRHTQVELWTRLDPNIPTVEGSWVHLSKALMNLVFNAFEAVSGSGTVNIVTGNRWLDGPIRGYDEIPEGEYVTVAVSDTGIGISPDDIERIFQPFFSKKALGRSGTGLGMAVVKGTVEDHRGFIDVVSKEGKGSTFTLLLPASGKQLRTERPTGTIDDLRSRGESILVIDDSEQQREIAGSMLRELGYGVIEAASGEEAVEQLRHTAVDLVVIDMIMEPGIDGLETYRQIIELHPRQAAVIISGFSETERVREAQRLGAGPYVPKPFDISKLGQAVRRELNRRPRKRSDE